MTSRLGQAALLAVLAVLLPSASSGQVLVTDLQAAIAEGHVTLVRASGNGRWVGGSVGARLRNETTDSLHVSVNFSPPMLFENASDSGASMIAIQVFLDIGADYSEDWGPFITLPPDVETSVVFLAFSVHLDKARPMSDHRFSVGRVPPELTEVVGRIRDHVATDADAEIWDAAQGAIWLARGHTPRQIREELPFSRDDELRARRLFLP